MPSRSDNDWRRCGQEQWFTGATLYHRHYRQYSKNDQWDHDHCRFCWATFTIDGRGDSLTVGYATEDDYIWVCEKCFADFHDQFAWKVIEAIESESEPHTKQ